MALTDDLIAYLNLDEASSGADAVVDYHENVAAADMRDVFGNVGAAPSGDPNAAGNRQLYGVGAGREYFDCINDATDLYDTSTGNYAVACWFTVEDFPQTRDLVSRWDNTVVGDQSWLLYVNGTTRKPRMIVRKDAANVANSYASDVTCDTGVMYFAVGQYDAVNDIISISIDGTTQYTQDGPGGTTPASKVNFFTIGATYAGLNTLTTQNGDMARVGLWRRLLTDAEITELYNSGDGLKYPFTAPATPGDPDDGSLGPGGRSKIFMPPFNPLP